MFHGEKVPGDPNDDRIVCAARPVLDALVKQALDTTGKLSVIADRNSSGG
jgi:hypothetical protein